MSEADCAAVQRVLFAQALRQMGVLRVLEWGSGGSTVYFTRTLRERSIDFHWVAVEHDLTFFDQKLRPMLWPGLPYRVDRFEHNQPHSPERPQMTPALSLAVFNYGRLRPYRPSGARDRSQDLTPYVEYPRTFGHGFDVIIVDGRMRRRCLLEGSRLLETGGLVMLHDAHRANYHCAFTDYRYHRFISDTLWVGCVTPDSLLL